MSFRPFNKLFPAYSFAAMLPQIVRRPVLYVIPLISMSLRLCVIPLDIFQVAIIYLAHLLALACELFILPDGIPIPFYCLLLFLSLECMSNLWKSCQLSLTSINIPSTYQWRQARSG